MLTRHAQLILVAYYTCTMHTAVEATVRRGALLTVTVALIHRGRDIVHVVLATVTLLT